MTDFRKEIDAAIQTVTESIQLALPVRIKEISRQQAAGGKGLASGQTVALVMESIQGAIKEFFTESLEQIEKLNLQSYAALENDIFEVVNGQFDPVIKKLCSEHLAIGCAMAKSPNLHGKQWDAIEKSIENEQQRFETAIKGLLRSLHAAPSFTQKFLRFIEVTCALAFVIFILWAFKSKNPDDLQNYALLIGATSYLFRVLREKS